MFTWVQFDQADTSLACVHEARQQLLSLWPDRSAAPTEVATALTLLKGADQHLRDLLRSDRRLSPAEAR